MKRIFSFLLAALMLFVLAGCAQNVDPYSVTLAAADDDYTESTIALPSEITFDRLTVCESDDFDIVIRKIKPDSPEGYVLSVALTNNAERTETTKTQYIYKTDDDGEKYIVGEEEVVTYTGDTYLFVVDSAVVNGTEVDVSFSSRLAADDRTFDQIVLDKAALDGLGTVTKIQMTFHVYVAGEEDRLVSKFPVTIYPYGNLDM